MIGAGLTYYNESATSYLQGNAKVYDGSFDTDLIASGWSLIGRYTPISMLCAVDIESQTSIVPTLLAFQNAGIWINIFNSGQCDLRYYSSNETVIRFNLGTGKKVFGYKYDGSGLSSGFKVFVNGVEVSTTTIGLTTLDEIQQNPVNHYIGSLVNLTTYFFKGKIRQLEFLNRSATDAEMIAATAANVGSFQGASVADSDYKMAVEFDKITGQNLTAMLGGQTFTGIGGTVYTPY